MSLKQVYSFYEWIIRSGTWLTTIAHVSYSFYHSFISSVPAASEDNVLNIPEPRCVLFLCSLSHLASYLRSPDPNMEPIWHGSVSMHLLPKFNACAYQVSGMADGLSDVSGEGDSSSLRVYVLVGGIVYVYCRHVCVQYVCVCGGGVWIVVRC